MRVTSIFVSWPHSEHFSLNTIIDSSENQYLLNSGNNAIDNSAESQILIDEITAMIETLDESLKVPFEMHRLGYKYQEIADKLRLPLGTVKSRIFFARKELKEMIGVRYPKVLERL